MVIPDNGYNGLSKVGILGDENLIPANIKNGVEIFGVQGNAKVSDVKITNASYLFYNGYRLDYLNEILSVCENTTEAIKMFAHCSSLRSLNLSNFDTSKVTNFSSMFERCSSLTTIPQFDTSSGTDFGNMFESCFSLTTVPQFDTSKGTNFGSMFERCSSLTDFGGLENLGQAYETTQSANYSNYKLNLSTCTALTEQSLMNVINNLYDIAAKGCNTQQLVLGSKNLAKLTAEEIAIATNKGFSVS